MGFSVYLYKGQGAAQRFASSPEAPLLGELSNEVRLRGCTKDSLPVSRSGTEPLRHACGVPPPLSRGGTGVSVRPTRDEQSLILSETVVPCYRDPQQLDKGYCPEATALCSRALSFTLYQASGVLHKTARHAKGSPSGRAVTEGD